VRTTTCWGRRIKDRHLPIWPLQVILQKIPAKANIRNWNTSIVHRKLASRTIIYLEIGIS
jgi:hypothetical protein